MTNPELVEWIQTAPGLKLNPDGHYGLQCVDAVDAYAQAIFGVHWSVCVGGVAGAKALLDRVPDEYWIRIDNDPNDPNLIPKQGDVVVFGGSPSNVWGHTAIVDSADQKGMNVIQQDGFAPPLVWADGALYSDKPAHRAWLPYYGTGTGMLIGWLRPREEKIINYTPPAPADPGPLPYQRDVPKDHQIGFRKAPNPSAELINWLEPDHRYDFGGYVQRDDFAVPDGGNTWFVGKYTQGFALASLFTDPGTHDLPNLTDTLFPPAKPVTPQPPKSAYLNGIDISGWQKGIDLTKVPGDLVAIKVSEGNGYVNPELAAQVTGARASGKSVLFYHFARPSAVSGSMSELEWYIRCVTPFMQLGDVTVLDWEAGDVYRTDWAHEWLAGAQARFGGSPWIYLNNAAVNRTDWTDAQKAIYNWDAVEAKFPLWLSSPDPNATAPGYRPIDMPFPVGWAAGHVMWQYSFKGKLDGYSGDLDLNIFYGDTAKLKGYGTTKLTSDPVVPPVTPEPEQPADGDLAKLTEIRDWMTGYIQKLGAKDEGK